MVSEEEEYLVCTQENKDKLPARLLKILLNQFDLIAWEMDVQKSILYPNEKTEALFGASHAPIPIGDLLKRRLYHTSYTGIFHDMHERLAAGDTHVACMGKVRLQDGKYHWLKVKYILFFDETGAPYKAIGCYDDMTDDEELRERYKQLKNYRRVFTSDAVIAYEVDLDEDNILFFDKESLDTNVGAGSSFDLFIQEVADKFVHPDFKDEFSRILNRKNLLKVYENGETEVVYEFISNENGIEYRWLRETVRLVRNAGNGHLYAFLYVKNIDKEKNEELMLRKHASRDPLTGLYNRNAFKESVNEYARRAHEEGGLAALIMLDIDDFKNINDTYGHVFGDAVLCMYADEIKKIFRSDDVISRLGGDEFVIFIKNINSKELAMRAAEKLCVGIRSWRVEGNCSFESSCSVGVSIYPDHGDDFQALYEKADAAQYNAKKNGKNHCCIYGSYSSGVKE